MEKEKRTLEAHADTLPRILGVTVRHGVPPGSILTAVLPWPERGPDLY